MKTSQKPAWLLFEDGTYVKGTSLGAHGTTGGEICFNTGMTGYQEIFTDPSYHGQLIIMTVAHLGNYGTIESEQESSKVQFKGLICNEMSTYSSRRDASASLHQFLEGHGITGICGVDTRALVRHIRDKGAMNAVISTESGDKEWLKRQLTQLPNMENLELSTAVTTEVPYFLGAEGHKVAVLDYGVKKGILDQLVDRGMQLQVFPAKTSLETMEDWKPDGYFLSNGPGDPSAMGYAVDTIKGILDTRKPMFGICLGHQLLALANGLTTFKMHNGHRGINHPVKNLKTGLSEITSQNHGFAVSIEGINQHPNLELTHINLNDNTVEGLRLLDRPAFSVQYHPESNPGPHDSHYLFQEFKQMLLAAN